MVLGQDNSNHHGHGPLNAGSTPLGKSAVPKTVELDTRIEMASYSFAQKNFDLTAEHAEHVLDEVPGDPRALALIAACEILLGNLDAGIIRLNQAINGTAIEKYEAAAEAAYEHLRFCDDDTVEISWAGFNECIQFLSQPEFVSDEDATAWRVALERARACVALERGDLCEGIVELKSHLQKYPNDVEARCELGRAYFHMEDYRVSTELFRQVLDEKPNHVFALSLLARVCAVDANYRDAIRYATEAFELNPQNCRTRLDLVEYLYGNHEYEDALAALENAPKCDCGWFRILHARMECYRELSDFESMLDACHQMMTCVPAEVSRDTDLHLGHRIALAHYILAIAKIDGVEDAMLKFEQEVEALVAEKTFALDTASLYREFEEFELARRLIECLSYELPEDNDVLFALSIAESEAGNFGDERMLLRQLIVRDPGRTMAYFRLSASYEREGLLKEALFWSVKGTSAGVSLGRLEYQVARVYVQLNSLDLGRQFLNAAIASNSSFRGRAEADEVFAALTN